MEENRFCTLSEMQQLQHLPSLTQLSAPVSGDAFIRAATVAGGGAGAAAYISRMLPRTIRALCLELDKRVGKEQAPKLLLDVVSHLSQVNELRLHFCSVGPVDVDFVLTFPR